MSGFKLKRLGMVIEPEPGNPQEAEGILNPAAARGPDGQLYLFPRLVAKGNYSRIGIARVQLSALRACSSMQSAIRLASRGWASHWSRKPIMSVAPMVVEAARTLV